MMMSLVRSSMNRTLLVRLPVIRQIPRIFFSAESGNASSDVPTAEKMIAVLQRTLGASKVEVTDISGGCGAFFKVLVVAPAFTGLPIVKAHRLVLDALEKEVGKMHGLTIETRKEV